MGINPAESAQLDKGATLDTILAFMISIVALSLPEMIIVRKLRKPGLIVIFDSVV